MSVTEAPSRPAAPRSPLGRRFLTVWVGQTVSVVGSTVSAVGAAVYAYAETGSAVWLGLLAGLAALPTVLAAPLMTVVDRLPRRTMMLAGDCFAAIGPTLALVLAVSGRLEIWHLGLAAFVSELGTAFQSPAAQAAVPLLVPAEALGRANSLAQLGPAVGIVVGPLVAAPLVAWWGITAVLLVDLGSFAVAMLTLAAVRFADAPRAADAPATDGGWAPVFAWLRGPGRPFRTLIATGAAVNGALALFNVAVLALATEIGGAGRAGVPVAAIGAAMVLGSIVSGVRGVGPDRIRTFVIGLLGVGAGCLVVAARPNLAFVAAGGALAVCLVPAVNAASATLFHERVPADMQGRLFGLRSAIGGGLYPVASASAGVLIAHVGAPLMDGPLDGSLGRLIGSGPERGAALVVLVAGALVTAIGVGLARSPLRATFRAG
ncbi:MAG TPA: MFS transporter [Ilumatobacter sp.]|nr:MFS transporter [Ilumatobacter sp.]